MPNQDQVVGSRDRIERWPTSSRVPELESRAKPAREPSMLYVYRHDRPNSTCNVISAAERSQAIGKKVRGGLPCLFPMEHYTILQQVAPARWGPRACLHVFKTFKTCWQIDNVMATETLALRK